MSERDPHIEDSERRAGYRDGDPDRTGAGGGDGAQERRSGASTDRRRRSIPVRILRVIAGVAGVLCIVFGIFVVVLQTEWGHEQAKGFLLKRLNALFDGAELSADVLSGSLVGDFTLTDVTLATTEGDTLAYVDTLQANYNLLYLLRNRLVLRDINLVDPWVEMEQQADGSWDLLNVIARDDSVAVDTVETFWTRLVIEFDQLDVGDGRVHAVFYAPGRDSTLRIRDLRLDVGESEFGEELVLDVNLLSGEFSPPGQSYWAAATMSGLMDDSSYIRVNNLALRSPYSRVQGRGTVKLPTEEVDYVDDVNFYLAADPITFADIRAFIPGFKAQGSADVELRLEGSGRRLEVDADVAFSDGGVFLADGTITPGGAGPIEYVLDVEARRLNPQTLLGEGIQDGVINADLDVALQGTDLEQLAGEVNAVLYDAAYGEYAIRRAELGSEWESGRAQFTLETALRGAVLSVSGAVRPFDDVPSYDVAGRISGLDLGNFTDGADLATNLRGRFTVKGQGLSEEAVDLTAEVALAPSTVNSYPIEDALLTVDWEGEEIGLGTRVLVPEGLFIAEGSLDRSGDVLQYEVQRGRFENFDFAALLGQEDTPSSFTGAFTLDGRGTDPENLDAEFGVELAQGSYGDIAIADATVRGTLDNGLLTAAVEADLAQSGFFDVTLITRPFQENPTLTFRDGEFRDVDLALLTDNPNLTTDLTGTIVGDLRLTGATIPTFEGRIDLDPSRINDQAINSASLVADLAGENLDFSLYLNLPEGQTRLIGTAQPFEDVPSYVVSDARFDNINLGAITGNSGLQSDLTGTASFRGRGLSLDDLTLTGRFNLSPSRINEQYITAANLAVDVNDGQLDFAARLNLPEGQTRLSGTADLLADVPVYRIREGSFENFNVGAFLGNADLQTNLTGTLALQGRGFDPQTATISGRVMLQESRINQQVINAATLEGDLRQGNLDYTLEIDLPEGDARLAGNAQLYAEPFTYTVEEGTFSGLNIGALTNNPNLDTYLTGHIVQLEGRGSDPEQMDLTAEVRLSESRINDQQIDSAYATLDFNDGNLGYDVFLDAPEGEVHLAGTAQPGQDPLAYAINEGTFRNLNLGALLGREDLQTDLTGSVSLEGHGFDPETMLLEADLDLRPSTINQGEIVNGDVGLLVQSGLVNLNADLILSEGRAQVIGTVRPFLDQPEYDVAGTLVDVNLGDFLGTDTLQAYFNADFELRGIGLDPQTATAQGNIQAATSRFEDLDVDVLFADFRLDEGLLEVDSLILRSSAADVTGAGDLALFDTTGAAPSDFTFDALIKDAEAINPYLEPFDLSLGEGTVEGRAYTENDLLRFDVDADLDRFAYREYRIAGLEGRIAGELGPDRDLRLGEARVTFDFAALPGMNLQTGNIEIRYRGDDIVFNVDIDVDERRDLIASGRIERLPEQRIFLETLRIRFDQDLWTLLNPAVITYGDEYRVSGLLLYSDDQQIAIDGVIDPDGYQNIVATVENFELAPVADLLGYEGLGGVVGGSFLMEGPASDPVIEGNLFLDIAAQEQDVGEGQVGLLYDDRRLSVDALLTNATGGTLDVDGYVPVDLTLAPGDSVSITDETVVGRGLQVQTAEAAPGSEVQLTVEADSFGIAWVEPFLNPEDYQEIEGVLDASISITGTMEQPLLEGEWVLVNGHIALPQIGIGLNGIDGQGTLESNQIRIERATMRSGSGTLDAEGSVNLQRLTLGEFDIQASLDNFTAMDTEEFQHVTVSGQMNLEGTTDLPVATGNATVLGADIYLDDMMAEEFAPVPLSQNALDELEAVFGYRATEKDTSTFVFFDALGLNIDLEFERDTWFRQRSAPEMAIQIEGELDVQKEAYADPQMFGTLNVVQGRSFVEQLGRRFEIESGRLEFQGSMETLYMDIAAVYRVPSRLRGEPEVTITLNMEGRLGEMEPELGSDIGLDQTDIVSYIATGRPASEAFELAGIGSELAISQLANLVEGVAAEELGLDVVSVRFDPLRGPQLVAGEYVTHDLFVGLNQSFGAPDRASAGSPEQAATEVTLEYEIFDWLLLRMVGGQAGGQQTLRVNLQWEQAY